MRVGGLIGHGISKCNKETLSGEEYASLKKRVSVTRAQAAKGRKTRKEASSPGAQGTRQTRMLILIEFRF